MRGPAPLLDDASGASAASPASPSSPTADDAAGAGAEAPARGDSDVVDEALRLFRANMLFRNFELQGGGDRLLVYCTLFAHLCLKRASTRQKADAAKELGSLAAGAHVAPGDAGWPLSGVIPPPRDAAELEAFRGYLRQLRDAVVARLLERAWDATSGAPSKHWAMYAKRKGFMGREFS